MSSKKSVKYKRRDEIENELKELTKKYLNGKAKYEANLMAIEDCSKMTTKQALIIKEKDILIEELLQEVSKLNQVLLS